MFQFLLITLIKTKHFKVLFIFVLFIAAIYMHKNDNNHKSEAQEIRQTWRNRLAVHKNIISKQKFFFSSSRAEEKLLYMDILSL